MVKSMFAAVAGLRAHQSRMDVIGNNIANVNTYGFKKARATFKDQFYATNTKASDASEIYGGGNPSQLGYGSQVAGVAVNFGSGGVATTDFATDVMIIGNGFFLTGPLNENGYRTTSNDDGSGRESLTALYLTRLGEFNVDGEGNLVDSAKNYVYGFRNYGDVGESPVYEKPVVDGNGVATGDSEKVLEALYIPKIVMGPNGDALRIGLDANGAATTVEDDIVSYSYVYADDANLTFDATTGAITGLPQGVIDPPDAAALANCYITGMKLSNIGIASDGTVSGRNDLSQNVIIGKIALANVPNANALEAYGQSLFLAGANTGVITAEEPSNGSTGTLQSGTLEMSNVDLAQEFTDMITTQRGFQANTRIITVTDEMLQELVNIKR